METSISKKATWRHLLKFSLPTIISMLLMSVFGIVDGVFVSRFIDQTALSAVGIVVPFIMFAMAIGFMLGTGGNALVAKKLGEGLEKEARENFSLISLAAVVLSVIMSVIGFVFPSLILSILGADEVIQGMAVIYMQPLLLFLPTVILGMVFQQFLITEGKAYYITITTFVGGVLNAGLNYLLIHELQMGLRGAAIATSIGYTLPFIVGIAYFFFNKKGYLRFVKPKFDIRVLTKTSTNGASEMVAMFAGSITGALMNNVVMRIYGWEAVAAASIMFAGLSIVASAFSGYASGIAPIISYNYGKGDTDNLKRVYKNSLRIIGVLSIIGVAGGWLLTYPLLNVYDVPIGTSIHTLTVNGLRIFTLGFVFMAYNAFASMMFTALNNGKLSALLSFFRTLVFVIISYLVLPEIFGINGAWAAMPFAELLAIGMTIYFLKSRKKVYKYA